MQPKRGKGIPEGRYDYTKSENGIPAMRAIWKGAWFSSEERIFVFAEHALKITPVDEEKSRGAAKWSGGGPGFKARHVPGIFGWVGFGVHLIRGAATDTAGTKGFIFHYTNDDGYGGMCWGLAPAECVEEILASVPADRIDPSIAPK